VPSTYIMAYLYMVLKLLEFLGICTSLGQGNEKIWFGGALYIIHARNYKASQGEVRQQECKGGGGSTCEVLRRIRT